MVELQACLNKSTRERVVVVGQNLMVQIVGLLTVVERLMARLSLCIMARVVEVVVDTVMVKKNLVVAVVVAAAAAAIVQQWNWQWWQLVEMMAGS
jgi:hypothetical protein